MPVGNHEQQPTLGPHKSQLDTHSCSLLLHVLARAVMVARRKERSNAGLIPVLIHPHFSSWGQVARCICQMRPSGKNTWTEVNTPSKFPFFDLFRVNELVINTFIPWCWMGNYSANCTFGGIAPGLAAIHPLFGLAFASIRLVRETPTVHSLMEIRGSLHGYVRLIQSLTENVLRFKGLWSLFTLAALNTCRIFKSLV